MSFEGKKNDSSPFLLIYFSLNHSPYFNSRQHGKMVMIMGKKEANSYPGLELLALRHFMKHFIFPSLNFFNYKIELKISLP